jgi:uncharacterized protein
MLWMIVCTDHAGQNEKRSTFLQEHKRYLETNMSRIFFSGRQESDDGLGVIGSVFILNTPTKQEAEDFIYNEPFYRAGIFNYVLIRRLTKRNLYPERAE